MITVASSTEAGAAALLLKNPALQYGLLGLVLGLLLGGFLYLASSPRPYGDEVFHAKQIELFLQGESVRLEQLTVLPIYHTAISHLAQWVGADSLPGWRLLSFLGSLLLLPAFYLLCRRISPSDAIRRTALLASLPILFPFFFLLYTDVWALLFVVLSIERSLAHRASAGACCSLVAIVLRQPSVFWLPLAALLPALGSSRFLWPAEGLLSTLRQTAPYAVVLVLFLAFVGWNGGIAAGDQSAHRVSLHLGNLAFLLLVFFLAWLPWHVSRLPAIWQLVRGYRLLSVVGLLAGLALYWTTFDHPHPYNQADYGFYLHNQILALLSGQAGWRFLGYVAMAWAVLSLLATPLAQPRFYWLYPLAIASVLVLPLIEQRYYLVPFALWLAFRASGGARADNATLLWMIGWNLYFLWGIQAHRFFL